MKSYKEKMQGIEIYDKPIKPTENIPKVEIIKEHNIYDSLQPSDKKKIEEEWKRLNSIFPGRLRNGIQASLIDTSKGVFSFQETDFKTYLVVSTSTQFSNAVQILSKNMRVACIGATIISKDGYLALGYRDDKMTHVPNTYDATIAGLALRGKDGDLDLKKSLNEKLKREFGLEMNDRKVLSVKYTGLHSSRHADYTAMFTFVIHVDMNAKEYIEHLDRVSRDKNFIIVHISALPNLIEKLFGANLERNLPCLDGAMTLAKSLSHEKFLEVINRLRKCRKDIQFGELINGKFIPSSEQYL